MKEKRPLSDHSGRYKYVKNDDIFKDDSMSAFDPKQTLERISNYGKKRPLLDHSGRYKYVNIYDVHFLNEMSAIDP